MSLAQPRRPPAPKFDGRQPQAAQRALALLEAVAFLGAGTTAKQIAEHTGTPAATTYRMLNMLVADGYLVRVPDLSGFALGRRTAELAQTAADESERSVSKVVDELRTETRHGLYLATFHHASLRVIDADPDHEMVPVSTITRNPHAHAIGKLLLAYRPDARSDLQLRTLTAHTIARPEDLERHLDDIRTTELAYEREESRVGRAALAVPVRDRTSTVVGGLCLHGVAGRVSDTNRSLVDFLRQGASLLHGLV